jgi:hypothetical protein
MSYFESSRRRSSWCFQFGKTVRESLKEGTPERVRDGWWGAWGVLCAQRFADEQQLQREAVRFLRRLPSNERHSSVRPTPKRLRQVEQAFNIALGVDDRTPRRPL